MFRSSNNLIKLKVLQGMITTKLIFVVDVLSWCIWCCVIYLDIWRSHLFSKIPISIYFLVSWGPIWGSFTMEANFTAYHQWSEKLVQKGESKSASKWSVWKQNLQSTFGIWDLWWWGLGWAWFRPRGDWICYIPGGKSQC